MKRNISTTMLLTILAFLLLENANIYALKILMSPKEAFAPNRTVSMYDKNFITGYYAIDCKLPILSKLPDHIIHATGGRSVHYSLVGAKGFSSLHASGVEWPQSKLNQIFLDGLFNHWIGEYFLRNPLTYNLQYNYDEIYYDFLEKVLHKDGKWESVKISLSNDEYGNDCDIIFTYLAPSVENELLKKYCSDPKSLSNKTLSNISKGYITLEDFYCLRFFRGYSEINLKTYNWIMAIVNALKENRYFTLLGGNFQREKNIDEKMCENLYVLKSGTGEFIEFSKAVYAPHYRLTDAIQTMLYYWMAYVFERGYLRLKTLSDDIVAPSQMNQDEFIQEVKKEIPSFIENNLRYRSLLP